MALADTAALVATLELKDKFSGTADKFDRRLGGMTRGVQTFGRNIAIAGAAGLGVLAVGVQRGIESLQELENVTAQTEAVIASTGGAAGVTASQVRDLAEKFEGLNATMDDKVIQSAENLLLTFTGITEQAFEPALQAALDMNQAMGGGEEGLQSTIIQVGKALNDPIRGATALRRVGVQLTEQQEDQIKALVEANDLYGAQQIILGELTREFGGSFARAGDTLAGKFAKFKDAVEDAQMSLATAFLPVLEKVADKLSTFLADPATQAAISELGTNLAEGFDALLGIADNLPWESIGDAFRLMGTGSKALLDAFLGLPPWVQTAVLTGWGLNKLTGGALTGIVGALTSGLVKGILGINAGVVNINAGVVNGGVPGAPGGAGAGVGGGVLGMVGRTAGLAGILAAIEGGILTLGDLQSPDAQRQDQGVVTLTQGPIGLITRAIEEVIGDPLGDLIISTKTLGTKTDQLYDATTSGARQAERDAVKIADQARTSTARQAEDAAKIHSDNARLLQTQAASLVPLQQIAAKPDPVTNVNVTSNVSITDITRRLVSFRISQGVRGGFTE